ncbi:hypothetical protein AG1IA_10270 [Rhizoctonia solani AG-1 IA]|uniref:Uncharacterized protein n=1 Tax=Thanatephorus cucumeris (strain AG1-IA) TaxID=983506 RepID=L8WCM4_THACA|nr:hypothetical protein AG1IA_10270 [Rhizoctonia solani AG-1 IA]
MVNVVQQNTRGMVVAHNESMASCYGDLTIHACVPMRGGGLPSQCRVQNRKMGRCPSRVRGDTSTTYGPRRSSALGKRSAREAWREQKATTALLHPSVRSDVARAGSHVREQFALFACSSLNMNPKKRQPREPCM